jgi:hypothetical protein
MHFRTTRRPRRDVISIGVALLCALTSARAAERRVSDDVDLKEIDLTGWDCANRPEGSAKTVDGKERNRLKNRPVIDIAGLKLEDFDVVRFLQGIAAFDSQTQNTRRKDLTSQQTQQLEPLEKQIVQLTGYLVLAYCGPPETTNCGSTDFHDWHLEVFEKPSDHAPQPGDPTPIVCEITPRTQNAIFHDGVRIQQLTAFFRPPDLTYQATGHAARKIRVIGYRLWDDEHNGTADVGESIRKIAANKFHNPWRRSAWEIHPVIKIIPLDGAPLTAPNATPSSPAAATPAAATSPTENSPPGPSPETTPVPTPAPPAQPQTVTLTNAVKIKIPYGETTLPKGMKLPVKGHDAQTVTIQYMGGNYAVPINSTDFH